MSEYDYTGLDPRPYDKHTRRPYWYNGRIVWIPDSLADQTGFIPPPKILHYNGFTMQLEM